ncbi:MULTISPECIES: FmdB family zinc ribbon protein [Streptomyces]|uniref:FmdB family zinc ribbon protein n=1 Tax=Streptomyces TaxID=1883 RepID=UPI0007C672F6|nr:FmdB family zinc ribbon protein [Streptomyces griseoruber]
MRIYDYACACGTRFEAMVSGPDAPPPPCADCGRPTRRLPSAGAALLGQARLPATADAAPKSWDGTHQGNTEYIAHWRRTLDARAALEERHPELAKKRSPVVAHEGPYHAAPLTADELASGTINPRRHAHPHPHPHPRQLPAGQNPGE